MRVLLSVLTFFVFYSQSLFSQQSQAFVHDATEANVGSNSTFIDHADLNGNPNAILLTTANWNPPGQSGIYYNFNSGVWYSVFGQQWAIFSQDLTAMVEGASFNVWIPGDDVTAWVHTAAAGNIFSNWTYLDHPSLNNNPNAIFFVDQNWNPSGSLSGVYNDNAIGIWYDDGEGKWGIFNQDYFVDMVAGASFNVMIPHDDFGAFVHTAEAGNITSNYTYLDHPKLNGNPDAIVLVTSNWNPPGSSGVYLDKSVGVWYSGSQEKWAIFNQDLTAMTEGAAFNVLVYQELTSSDSELKVADEIKAFPNPVADHATISFDLKESADVTVAVYDIAGNLVSVLADGFFQQGSHSLQWNASGVANGLYFCRLQSGASQQTIKLNRLR